MWSRAQLKERAKYALRQNYWKTVLVTLIVFLIGGATTTFNFKNSSSDNSDSDFFYEFEQIWENNFASDNLAEFDTVYMTTGGEVNPNFGGEDYFPNEESSMIDFDELSDLEYSDQYDREDVSDLYLQGYKDGFSGQEAVMEDEDYSKGYQDGLLDYYEQNVLYEDTFIDNDISYNEDTFGAFDTYLENDSFSIGDIVENGRVMAIAGLGAVLVLVVALIAFLVIIFLSVVIYNPLEVGTKRFFIHNLNQPAEVKEVAYAFDHSYKNVISILFTRDLCVIGWSLLFVIPGIIKELEYRMIPYLLAENPNLTKEQAFALSKQMMTGNKWNAFVLDLSFIGWDFLSACTLGILGIFYVQPYKKMTDAVLYDELSAINGRPAFSYQSNKDYYYQHKEDPFSSNDGNFN